IFLKQLSSLPVKNYWGTLSHVGEGRGEGTRPHHPLNRTIHHPTIPHPSQSLVIIVSGKIIT
ncbi:hypothetical protein, partial [Enterobacter cloacae]|uniref:hypothetical protein n=1 Tax=Enterobacter cloacae TaxID=550 RepID=UPI001C8B715D